MTTVTSDPAPLLSTTLPTVGGPMKPRRFAGTLTGVVVFGLALRLGYVLLFTRYENTKFYDAFWYSVTSGTLSDGQFFRIPFGTGPTAAHPPMTSFLIGAPGFVDSYLESSTGQRLTMAVLGAAVVLCVGLLGRSVAGPRVGLVAAALAALAPNFWIPSGIIMSETPAMLFMALILLAVVHLLRRPNVLGAVLLGAACGGEALVRAELILFVPALLVPAALLARQVPLRRRFMLVGVGVLATAVVLAPWVARNLATFKDATYISTGEGLALLGSNCAATYHGPSLGSWSLACAISVTNSDESVASARESHAAIEFAKHHDNRLPTVILARVGRLWDFYEPIQMADVDVNEGRPRPASLAGLVFYYALLPFAVAGIVILRRRRIDQWFLLVPAGVVTIVSVLAYGLVRFRAPFEVCLVVMAAPPLVLIAQRLGRTRTDASRVGSTSPEKQADEGSSVPGVEISTA
jgi:4-amino-4-deoxy-L-arabinose transferase-like glycosyltransferase